MCALGGYAGWDMVVRRCVFERNTYAVTGAEKVIYDSVFRDNEYGLYETERVSVYDSTFTGNEVALYGGRGEVRGCYPVLFTSGWDRERSGATSLGTEGRLRTPCPLTRRPRKEALEVLISPQKWGRDIAPLPVVTSPTTSSPG